MKQNLNLCNNNCIKLMIGISVTFIILLYVGFNDRFKRYNQITRLLRLYSAAYKVNSTISNETITIELKSDCECRKDDTIEIIKNGTYSIVYLKTKTNRLDKKVIEISEAEFLKRSLTCDPYKVLRRGQHQKTIGFSLYGKNRFYYDKLKNISNSKVE